MTEKEIEELIPLFKASIKKWKVVFKMLEKQMDSEDKMIRNGAIYKAGCMLKVLNDFIVKFNLENGSADQ
jgi:hypothetical protein